MSNIKKFKVSHNDDNEVTLEVDTTILTTELATVINEFWGHAGLRLSEQHGDVVQVVARMFGVAAIRAMDAEGGLSFSESDVNASKHWTAFVLDREVEGWPKPDNLGMRITSANVYVAEYFSVLLDVL